MARDVPGGNWVQAPDDDKAHPYYEGSDRELMRLRKCLPLNGETAFADTAAAFAALPPTEQAALERVQLRRRLNEGDEGWLAPLVRTNPRSGIKSLHSPIWASRPRVRPAIEVEGMSAEASRAFLDRLEAHVLQPQFRYDHPHAPGDVTLWDNYMTSAQLATAQVEYQLARRCPAAVPLELQGRASPVAAATGCAGVARCSHPRWLCHAPGDYRHRVKIDRD